MRIATFLLLTICLTGCTSTFTESVYRELARSQHLRLAEPGYVVAFEKQPIVFEDGLLPGLRERAGYRMRFQERSDDGPLSKSRNRRFRAVTTGQRKVMLATHITRNFANHDFLYNAYAKDPDRGDYNYEDSFNAIDELANDLQRTIDEAPKPYTHLLIMCMGWNNDQVESVWRYNEIVKQLRSVAMADGVPFRPLIVGLTWPSVWGGASNVKVAKKLAHYLSYPNKADDADELGFTWVNWLMNHTIPQALNGASRSSPKVVVIAHSFGARLMSRAVFSQSHIRPEYSSSSAVDLFIGLQGAFSANRFVPTPDGWRAMFGGREGAPYAEFSELPTRFVFTSSKHDDANPVAHWITGASHIGGKHGLCLARRMRHQDVFATADWAVRSVSQPALTDERVLVVDCASIVSDKNDTGHKAHNDILDMEMAKFIWHFLRQLDR